MDRTNITAIFGTLVTIREAYKDVPEEHTSWSRGHLLVERASDQKVIAIISPDGFFDGDGNFFDMDAA